MKSGKIVAIVNQKGGVGKTTTAINIASLLSERGFSVLLVDIDPQANATSGIGLRVDKVQDNLYDLLINNQELSKVLYPTPFKNLHIIPSSRALAGAEIEMVSIVSRETILKNRLAPLKDYYDYIVLDCPPSLGLLTLNALVASDKVIIPVQCEYYALEGLAGLVETITLVQESLNPSLEIAGILLTMFDKRTALNKQVLENTRKFFKDLVFDTIIPRNIRLTEAPSHGLPIILYYPKSVGALSYINLVEEVINRV
ncbi:MAG: AAA family ATPase [Candidatus Margulisiibacteriota bacterium]|jgi:chromosome partitioning protein